MSPPLAFPMFAHAPTGGSQPQPYRGRGALSNPPNRFEHTHFVAEEEQAPASQSVPTQIIEDTSESILSSNKSPDIPFDFSLNPYRGCSHGCSYCYARPTHEYLGFSSGLDFESRIVVKPRAAELLRRILERQSWQPKPLWMSGVTDPYQPIEREWQITRACLEVLAEFRNPVSIITKNALVERDRDLLASMAEWQGAHVTVSITTLDASLARRMEPRTASPNQRLETIQALTTAGIPCSVAVSPVIPGINDTEVPAIIEAAARHGAIHAWSAILRLPGNVDQIFLEWLQHHYPRRVQRVLDRLRSLRSGRLNDNRFGSRFKGQGIWAAQHRALLQLGLRKAGMTESEAPALNTGVFRRLGGTQLELIP